MNKEECIKELARLSKSLEFENKQMGMLIVFIGSLIIIDKHIDWTFKNLSSIEKVCKKGVIKGLDIIKDLILGGNTSESRAEVISQISLLSQKQEDRSIEILLSFICSLIILEQEVKWVDGNSKLIIQIGKKAFKRK